MQASSLILLVVLHLIGSFTTATNEFHLRLPSSSSLSNPNLTKPLVPGSSWPAVGEITTLQREDYALHKAIRISLYGPWRPAFLSERVTYDLGQIKNELDGNAFSTDLPKTFMSGVVKVHVIDLVPDSIDYDGVGRIMFRLYTWIVFDGLREVKTGEIGELDAQREFIPQAGFSLVIDEDDAGES